MTKHFSGVQILIAEIDMKRATAGEPFRSFKYNIVDKIPFRASLCAFAAVGVDLYQRLSTLPAHKYEVVIGSDFLPRFCPNFNAIFHIETSGSWNGGFLWNGEMIFLERYLFYGSLSHELSMVRD